MATKAQIRAQEKYDKKNTYPIMLKLNLKNDADVLEKLRSEENKQGYIKHLIRSDMQKKGSILEIDDIRMLILPIVKKYNLTAVSLFGSYSRNEATVDSDVDLLIDGGNYKGLFEYAALIDALKKALGREVDVVTLAALKRDRSKADKLFRINVEKDLVVLYDQN